MDTLDLEVSNDVDQLRIIPLFNEISKEKLKYICNKLNFSWIDKNKYILNQGDSFNLVLGLS